MVIQTLWNFYASILAPQFSSLFFMNHDLLVIVSVTLQIKEPKGICTYV